MVIGMISNAMKTPEEPTADQAAREQRKIERLVCPGLSGH